MRSLYLIIFLFLSGSIIAQSINIKGQLLDDQQELISFANVVLYDGISNAMLKAEVSDLDGHFNIQNVSADSFYIEISYIGLESKSMSFGKVSSDLDLGQIVLKNTGVQIETAVVVAKRALVEVKPDKTVFNVEGTINSAGEDAIGLLRKAPGVLLDNNDNISVLGRSGVILYIDGKKLPLSGEELTNYLESIPSEQIDRFDIITNPSAKYEAEGNAGIIDIRLKKDKNLGTNGTISSSMGKGVHYRYNANLGLNRRTRKLNLYGNLGVNNSTRYLKITNENYLNDLFVNSSNRTDVERNGFDGKLGLDYFINENHTMGVMYSGGNQDRAGGSEYLSEISSYATITKVDSVLVANNETNGQDLYNTFNLNYAFNKGGRTLNVDADYGKYDNFGEYYQPNVYMSSDRLDTLSSNIASFNTPVDIQIYTLKADYEQKALGGQLGFGAKISRVLTDNTFEYSNFLDDEWKINDLRSNNFVYVENVYAGYVSYSRKITEKLNTYAGLRMEITDAVGDLTTFDTSVPQDPVDLDYIDYFPSAGISYSLKQGNTLNLAYGRRLNRPDYNVLNPFKEQRSELSFLKGNPFLKPEIVNNIELGYTHGYKYNFKLSYSRTQDQITRLIGPDDVDPRASFLSWDNLATQDVYALNASLPLDFTNWWNAFFNLSGSYVRNRAVYENGAEIDLEAWTYSAFTQQTFKLPYGITAELSGRYSGPGIWGGVFRYEASWVLNTGLQKKFLKNKLNVKLAMGDLFNNAGWKGVSYFNGLENRSVGKWDSRRLSLSLSYKFGNNKIKTRDRKTGIDEESKRVGEAE